MMFLPAGTIGTDAIDVTGFDCSSINSDTKGILSMVNKGQTVYVYHKDGYDTALGCAAELNDLSYKLRNTSILNQKIVHNGQYNHRQIQIQDIKLYPLIEKGVAFTAKNDIFTVTDVCNYKKGNISIPLYTVQSKTAKHERVTQNYLLNFTGVMLQNETRKVADIWVGTPEMVSLWTVSFDFQMKYLYCSSPSSAKGYKWTRCIDEFGTNCLEFIESAIMALVLDLSGTWMKSHFSSTNSNNYTSKDQSCRNCLACRFLTGTDIIEGDAPYDLDVASRGTEALKTDGSMTNAYVCAFSMECPGADRLEDLNKEQIYGSNTSGYMGAFSEHYKSEALDCSKYHSQDSKYIRNTVHTIETEGRYTKITTAGFEILFDRGVEKPQPPKPTAQKKEETPAQTEPVYVTGNILDCNENLILHQVNCKGVMGSGLAKQIRNKWSRVYESYKKSDLGLGKIFMVPVDEDRFVVNCCGQDAYGNDGKQYTDYAALEQCFSKVAAVANKYNYTVAIPAGMGCGLGGGNWDTVYALIKKYLPMAKIYEFGSNRTLTNQDIVDIVKDSSSHPDDLFVLVGEGYNSTARRIINDMIREDIKIIDMTTEMAKERLQAIYDLIEEGGNDGGDIAEWAETIEELENHIKSKSNLQPVSNLKAITCHATGYRPDKLGGYKTEDNAVIPYVVSMTDAKIAEAYKLGYRRFISGMALGFDLIFAERVLVFKQTHPDVILIAAVPCKEHTKKWVEAAAKYPNGYMPAYLDRYYAVLKLAEVVTTVVDATYDQDPRCMQKRNEWMVDRSSRTIACWDGSKGGTGNCVTYAKTKGLTLDVFNPTK